MPARLIAYLPDGPAATRWLQPEGEYRIGRGDQVDLDLADRSVSRHHARLQGHEGAWQLLDGGSKNGSFVDGERVEQRKLNVQHWLRFGDVHCEFRLCAKDEAQADVTVRQQRMAQSTALGERLAASQDRPDLLRQTLQAVVALAECERGFLLFPDESGLRVAEACGHGIELERAQWFPGSRSAIQRALSETKPVVVNDTRHDLELSGRASVVSGGIRSLLALPLLHANEAVAVIYADRRGTAHPITDFDIELVLAFAERAAVWISAQRGFEALQQMPLLDQSLPPGVA